MVSVSLQMAVIVSATLEETDKMPKGKRAYVPLRLQERQIAAALADSLILYGGELTAVQLCERYL